MTLVGALALCWETCTTYIYIQYFMCTVSVGHDIQYTLNITALDHMDFQIIGVLIYYPTIITP